MRIVNIMVHLIQPPKRPRKKNYRSSTERISTRLERTCNRLKPMVDRCDGKKALDSLPLEMIQGCTFSDARRLSCMRVHKVVRLRSAMTDAKSTRAAASMP